MDENAEEITIKLEGRLVGPWTAELDHLWREIAPKLSPRNLSLDLRETTFADASGIRALRTIYSQTGAAILAGSTWTQYLAEEIKHNETQTPGEA